MAKNPKIKTTSKTAAKASKKVKAPLSDANALLNETLGYLGLLGQQLRDQYPAIAEIEKNLPNYEKAGLTVGRCFSPPLTQGDYAGMLSITKAVEGRHVVVGGILLYSKNAHSSLNQAMHSYCTNSRTSIDDIASLKDDQEWHVDDHGIPYSTKSSHPQKMRRVQMKMLQVVSDFGVNAADFFMTGSEAYPLVNMIVEKVGNTFRQVANIRETDGYLTGKAFGVGDLDKQMQIGDRRDIQNIANCIALILQVAGKTLDEDLKSEIAEKVGSNPEAETYVWANPLTREWYANNRKTYLYDDRIEWTGPRSIGEGDEPAIDGLKNIKYALPPKEEIAHKIKTPQILSEMLKAYIVGFEERMASGRLDADAQRLVSDIVLDMERGRHMIKVADEMDLRSLMHPMMGFHDIHRMHPGYGYPHPRDNYREGRR